MLKLPPNLDSPSFSDCTAPFIAQIVTDATAGAGADPETFVQRGICLEYKQIPC